MDVCRGLGAVVCFLSGVAINCQWGDLVFGSSHPMLAFLLPQFSPSTIFRPLPFILPHNTLLCAVPEGDLGRFNPITGDLIVTGRAKDTIVLSNGENVEPQPLEVCY